MQLSIPSPALRPRAGPYSHAIVGYGIHWNHLAECTTAALGSYRPSFGICLRSSSFVDRLFREFRRNLIYSTSEAAARSGAPQRCIGERIERSVTSLADDLPFEDASVFSDDPLAYIR